MPTPSTAARLGAALAAPNASTRLAAAMAAGTHPSARLVAPLVQRCAVEPDFYVRDMLTWALTRQDAGRVVPALLAELDTGGAQARSQALHTLSKIGEASSAGAITSRLLHERDDEVARSAWRAAVVLTPVHGHAALAAELGKEFGRGGREVQRSLSRALVALGEAAEPVIEAGRTAGRAAARAHAEATRQLRDDPEAGFAIDEARRAYNLKDAPT